MIAYRLGACALAAIMAQALADANIRPAPGDDPPAYERSAPSLYHFWHSPNGPLELLGANLTDGDRPLTGGQPAIQEGNTLSAELFLRRMGVLPAEAKLQLHIQGTGPAYTGETAIDWGAMEPGGVYTWEMELRLPRLRYSGQAALKVQVLETEDDPAPATLFSLPLMIEPDLVDSDVDAAKLREAFGETAQRLNYAVRLGPGAETVFPLPAEQQGEPWGGIGLVSRLEFSPHFERGQRAATLRLYRDGAVIETMPVLANTHTAFGNRDYHTGLAKRPPGAPVFDSWDSDGLNEAGEPFELHLFAGTFALPEPLEFDGIGLEYEADIGLLEVRDVVLLPEANAAGDSP
ncbi:MAG: hypothetical protein ACLFV4_07330 [Candidatus Hydrogenedentota bacterium]